MTQMMAWLATLPARHASAARPRHDDVPASPKAGLAWSSLPRAAHLYVAAIIAAGGAGLFLSFPVTNAQPGLFAVLLGLACVTSILKVNLPIPLMSGSTLSMSYAADLMALLLLGPRAAVIVAIAGAWAQCTINVKQPYPIYRTAFSMAAESITMIVTGLVYESLGGPRAPLDFTSLPKPLLGAIAAYFVVNTGLVAGAIGASSGRSPLKVWRQDFLWSGASFVVAGSAGAAAAVVVTRGDHWKAILMLAPIYLTYWTYQALVGRLEDQRRHVAESERLRQDAVDALVQATDARRELAAEKERLAEALADMTRLKELRNRLLEREQVARSTAEQANRLKDQFLAIVSHELRTPLNAMLGWSEMLRSGLLDEPRRRRAVQAIHGSAQRQAHLIDELLDVSRIMSGNLRLERSAVNWSEIVQSAVEVVQPAASAKRIDLAADVDATVASFYGDGARLQQIVWNLLTNAIKFTPDGGSVRLRLAVVRDQLDLAVTDTGQGIEGDFLPAVFEPFRQGDGSSTRRHGGLGLGLSIVKQLVEAHGGTITVDSRGEGFGSTFRVRLPIIPAQAAPGALAPRTASAGGGHTFGISLEGLSVLVVDDDDESREIVVAYLEGSHAEVLTASSAAEALDVLEQTRVDVLLADIAMPGQDGYELIRQLRATSDASTASIPAAALTAFARKEDRRRALDAGFQLHLTKPIAQRALVDAVAALARRSGIPTGSDGVWPPSRH